MDIFLPGETIPEDVNFAPQSSTMFKFLLILLIIGYVLFKIGSFFYRAGVMTQRMKEEQNRFRSGKSAPKKGGKIRDGEYVDYEDVK